MKVYFNNKFIDEEKATINIKDRGLLLGDSIFDTLLYNNQKIILFDFHFARFNKSIKNNYFNFNLSKKNLENIIFKLVKKNNLLKRKLSIRCTLTRGYAKRRGLDIEKSQKSNFLITVSKLPLNNDIIDPVKLKVSKIKRLSNSLISRNKTNNYFENIQSKLIAQKNGYDDALILNEKDKICCCSSSNIYFVKKNKIFTPPINDGALDGTVRRYLIEKKKVEVRSISLNNLTNVSEIFLTNSIGLRPVSKINNRSFKNGPITEKITEYLNKLGI